MTTPFERALGAELAAAAQRDQQRATARGGHRLRRVVIGLLAAVVVAIGAIVVATSGPATADVEVSTRAGRVEVLISPDATPAEIVRGVRGAGVEVTTEGVPTGPSEAGRYVGTTASAGVQDLRTIQAPDRHGVRRTGFSVPVGWTGHLVVREGRAARPGQPYQVSTDAFAVGEPLHCSGLRGVAVGSVGHRLDRLTVRVQTVDHGAVGPTQLTLAQAEGSDFAGWRITSALMVSSSEVLVQIDGDTAVPLPSDPSC